MVSFLSAFLTLTSGTVSYAATCPCVEAKKAGKAAARLKAIGKAIKLAKAKPGKKLHLKNCKATARKLKDQEAKIRLALEKVKTCADGAKAEQIIVVKGKVPKKLAPAAAKFKQQLIVAEEELRQDLAAEALLIEELDSEIVADFQEAEIDLAIAEEAFVEPVLVAGEFITAEMEAADVAAAEAAYEAEEHQLEALEGEAEEVEAEAEEAVGEMFDKLGEAEEALDAAAETVEEAAENIQEELSEVSDTEE